MVRGAVVALHVALALCCARGSVLVPTYVLPPDSFVRDQRSLASDQPDALAAESRTIKRLIGGHMKIKPEKQIGDPTKNTIPYDAKSESGKFVGAAAGDGGGTIGWNQGIWDDGMLMSSAGEGKETKGVKSGDDEDRKTLSDQVAEGKYGLIQNEIFAKNPKRPGIISYEPNSETRTKDNIQNLGGLTKDEIWLAEDQMLVLTGGSFPERTKEADTKPWPPIDNYEAPRRQVKLPQKPNVPPPFPVRLADDGPLVFLTQNGSVPASLFASQNAGEGQGSIPFPPLLFPQGETYAPGENQGNSSTGGAPFLFPPFPFLPGNENEGGPFPFPPSINGSFPEGFPPGAAFLPPPNNQSDLYDEDDPSIYYPPPYSFFYHGDYNNSIPAGPLVPGIVLPPPPDFFAPQEEGRPQNTETATKTTSTAPSTPITARPKPTYKPRPSVTTQKRYKTTSTTTTESVTVAEEPSTLSTPPSVIESVTTPKARIPQRIVEIPLRQPIRVLNLPEEVLTRPKAEKTIYKSRTKIASKPVSVSVIYDYPENYERKPPAPTPSPYIIYSVPEKTHNSISDNLVTSTPVPLRTYFRNVLSDEVPTTKLQPVYNRKPTENSVASFYYFDEQPKPTPKPSTYFNTNNYYNTIPVSNIPVKPYHTQTGFSPSVDVSYGAFDQADALFVLPQKQGTRTLTQEYFSVQKARPQQLYVQQHKRPDFYQQIADIQQTIDYYTTKRPKHAHRPHTHSHKPKAITSRPVYQYSYQAQPRPEVNFRAPKLDPEPFRPMVSYSKPFNLENEFNAITPSVTPSYHQQYLIENVQVTTETPTSSRYYPKTKPIDDEYDDAKDTRNTKKNNNHIPLQNERPTPIVHISGHNRHSSTASPVSHGYYTKQDENYFDEITKNSFNVFGKKIEDGQYDANGLGVTPPLSTVRTPINNNINLQYDYELVQDPSRSKPPNLHSDTEVNNRYPRPPINPDSEPINPQLQSNNRLVEAKPPSLAEDTLVNNRHPRPQINPDSEFIPIPNPIYSSQKYTQHKKQYASELEDLNRPTLYSDTSVNYNLPVPIREPEAEWIGPVNTAGEGRPGSFVSYRLPGDGAHVYFLTPQATRERYRSSSYGR